MLRPLASVALLLLMPALALHAQDEAALRRYFEGRTVQVRIDMPATSKGIDVWPHRAPPLEDRRQRTAPEVERLGADGKRLPARLEQETPRRQVLGLATT
mgnify:CR=1 FL=1